MTKGDIVLLPFPFTDLSGSKNRPALVLIPGVADVTVAFISTQLQSKENTDVLLRPSQENGLKKDSLLRLGKIATIDKGLVLGRLGRLDARTLEEVDRKLVQLFSIKMRY